MADITPHPEGDAISDAVIAKLRTGVPMVWGVFVAWLIVQIPNLPQVVIDLLNSELVLLALGALASYLWYLLWGKVKRFVPAWLLTIAVGSAKKPVYKTDHEVAA